MAQLRRWHSLTFLLIAIGVVTVAIPGCPDAKKAPSASINAKNAHSVLFCHWNVDNFFDDREDGRKGEGDAEYDPWMARNPAILKLKLSKLCDALLAMNDGKGPDILAMVEVESPRAAELLKEALNQRLQDPALHYQHVLMKEVTVGRHIAPALLTRLPVVADRTRDFGRTDRILQGVVKVRDHELIILAAHWTSRLRDGSAQRAKYANKMYGAYRAIVTSNPQADVLVCGDFNDDPTDISVAEHLHSTGNRDQVRSAQPPLLFNLFAGKDPGAFGTLYYNRRWHIFDQILVSSGMLDNVGWSCDVESAKAIRTLTRPGDKTGQPWRFGNEKTVTERGYSDHFPVTVRLNIAD